MRRAPWSIAATFTLLSLTVVLTPAAAEEPGVSAGQPNGWTATGVPKQACGRQLMTDTERQAYRTAMQSLETNEERERLRKSIHEAMKVRARELGLTLPDEPPARSGTGHGAGCMGGQGHQHGRSRSTT